MPKKCIIRTISDNLFIDAVKSSFSYREVLRKLNIPGGQRGEKQGGTSFNILKKRIESLNINIFHFTGQHHMKGKVNTWMPTISLSDLLVENSSYKNPNRLKKRLIKEGILKNICECGQKDLWNGKPLVLQLDHINGVSNDNRIENLRILCPNCHTQTDTYAGKNPAAHPKLHRT